MLVLLCALHSYNSVLFLLNVLRSSIVQWVLVAVKRALLSTFATRNVSMVYRGLVRDGVSGTACNSRGMQCRA